MLITVPPLSAHTQHYHRTSTAVTTKTPEMAKRPGILLPWPTLVMSALILAMIFLSSTSMAYNFNTEEKTLTPAGGRMQNSLYGYHRFHPTINDKVNFLEVCIHCFWYIFSKKSVDVLFDAIECSNYLYVLLICYWLLGISFIDQLL